MAPITTQRASRHHMVEKTFSAAPSRLAVAVAALLGSHTVHSAVQIDSVTWESNVAGYITAAYTCPNATGGAAPPDCEDAGALPLNSTATNANDNDLSGDPDADKAIYSWGLLAGQNNSTYTWWNPQRDDPSSPLYDPNAAAFRVDSIQLAANGAVGTRPYDGGGSCNPNNPPAGENCVGVNQGSGILSTWELGSSSANSLISEARVQFTNQTAGGNYTWDLSGSVANPAFPGSPFVADNNQLVYTDPRSATASLDNTLTWFSQSPPDGTWQTPIDRTFVSNLNGQPDVEDLAIEPGESIRIRLFEEATQGQSNPDAVLSDTVIVINGTTANLQADPATQAVRVGTVGNVQASVNNGVGDADGFRALEVVASDPSNRTGNPEDRADLFASVSGQNMGTLDFGETENPVYNFSATSLSGNTTAQTCTAGVSVTSSDATGTEFVLTADAVGPVSDLSGTGVGTGTIDLPNATVGGAGSLVDLDLGNLFSETSYAAGLTNLGILAIGFDTGSGLVDSLSGFSLGGLPTVPFNIAALGSEAFQILFNPADTGYREVDLIIRTDVGAVAGGDGADYTYKVRGTGGGTTPAPGTLALMAFMLGGLGVLRRRRT